ncbi:MAG: SagB/ThcOx family dehydrogenase [Christensenellales bacterium]|jgi:SagB-type dehydrogenase family enzyme
MDDQQIRQIIQSGRRFMRMPVGEQAEGFVSDQQRRLPQPPLCKPAMRGPEARTALGRDFQALNLKGDLVSILSRRKSSRVYTGQPMSLLELSFLLWAQQGVRGLRGRTYATLRTVPCGGARHEFECYLTAQNIEGLADGLYHYLPMEHAVEFLGAPEQLPKRIGETVCGQRWAAQANAVFYYSMVPYRAEWRYGVFAHRTALIDAGHITENLYLACSAAGLGACAIAAVDADASDGLFGLDGEEEFIFYCATAGRVRPDDADAEQAFYAFVDET